jgi:uncharacterized SAM-binding protein YcdF (DUF218 family)
MIARLGALLLLFYALGFVLFAFTLGKPASADAPATDAAIVLTGGPGRIEHAIEVVRDHQAKRLLVDGVDPSVTKADLARRIPGSRPWLACCVDLGSESVDTRSNAEEAGRWLAGHDYRSVRLITSDWHMRRARYEFEKVLGRKYELITDAVRTEPSFLTLFGEYNKYLLRRLAVWADL